MNSARFLISEAQIDIGNFVISAIAALSPAATADLNFFQNVGKSVWAAPLPASAVSRQRNKIGKTNKCRTNRVAATDLSDRLVDLYRPLFDGQSIISSSDPAFIWEERWAH